MRLAGTKAEKNAAPKAVVSFFVNLLAIRKVVGTMSVEAREVVTWNDVISEAPNVESSACTAAAKWKKSWWVALTARLGQFWMW
jgi:hypothetical protein